MNESVLVLVSGGVDSSIATHILREQGFRVQGLFLRMTGLAQEEQALERTLHICDSFGVRVRVEDVRDRFRKDIIRYFEKSYLSGLTPNCCCVCNWRIKIQTGLEVLKQLGMDFLATGHYARIQRKGKQSLLLAGRDPKKDQSYFLHQLRPKALERMILPLGDISKEEVKKMAERLGLLGLLDVESQDICFFKGDYRAYFQGASQAFLRPGPIVTTEGRRVGTHHGICSYTVGQRRGLGISDATPFYVMEIRADENVIVVGKKEELFKKDVLVEDVNWIVEPEACSSLRFNVKIRSRHRAVPAILTFPRKKDKTRVKVRFDAAQRAVTPGQFAVFYAGQVVAGGGRICA